MDCAGIVGEQALQEWTDDSRDLIHVVAALQKVAGLVEMRDIVAFARQTLGLLSQLDGHRFVLPRGLGLADDFPSSEIDQRRKQHGRGDGKAEQGQKGRPLGQLRLRFALQKKPLLRLLHALDRAVKLDPDFPAAIFAHLFHGRF
ncbi:hypothetical protein [Rhizobium sp. G21]|uniref:hypothetical protein n=1 Tax=Rhizobium sp. G21 TaxID=2758439 RepID=UPI001FF070B4|nr:hypothetical protein [Rhizobium sp. G21]